MIYETIFCIVGSCFLFYGLNTSVQIKHEKIYTIVEYQCTNISVLLNYLS